jgi:hypothetical protein
VGFYVGSEDFEDVVCEGQQRISAESALLCGEGMRRVEVPGEGGIGCDEAVYMGGAGTRDKGDNFFIGEVGRNFDEDGYFFLEAVAGVDGGIEEGFEGVGFLEFSESWSIGRGYVEDEVMCIFSEVFDEFFDVFEGGGRVFIDSDIDSEREGVREGGDILGEDFHTFIVESHAVYEGFVIRDSEESGFWVSFLGKASDGSRF